MQIMKPYLKASGVCLCLCFALSVICTAQKSVTTQHNDIARTGWNNSEITLTQANVRPGSFGKIFTRYADDKIYGQPLVALHVNIPTVGYKNILYVVTQKNTVYAYDADAANASSPYWQLNLTPQDNRPLKIADLYRCSRQENKSTDNIGIVSTPVIDSATGTIYILAKSYDTVLNQAKQYLHALDISTGAEKPNSPVLISASVPGTGLGSVNGTLAFDALRENQRCGLLLINNLIVICWGSHCDWDPYHGWVMGYDKTTMQQKVVYCDTPDGHAGGIWMSGGGPAADSDGNIYFASGDGSSGINNDASNPINRGQSAVKLKATDTGFVMKDFFTPFNYLYLDTSNGDMTSQFMLVPGAHVGLCVDKYGQVYVVNTDSMGKFNNTLNSIVNDFSLNPGLSVHSSLSFYGGTKKEYAYIWPGATALKAIPYSRAQGRFYPDSIINSEALIYNGIFGAFTSVSSNGAADSTAILWASHVPSGEYKTQTKPGMISAYAADDVNTELWNSNISPGDSLGSYAKFVCPTIANGKLYVATPNNQVVVYGLTGGSPETCVTSNVALGKPVSASTYTGANLPSNVNDGISATSWISAKKAPQYIFIDLGIRHDICKVVLRWNNIDAKNFAIQVSDDSLTWITVSNIKSNFYVDNVTLVSGSGRYVRMYGLGVTKKKGFSLREFEVYGRPAALFVIGDRIKAAVQ